MMLFATSDCPVRALADARGFVLGTVFDAVGGSAPNTLPAGLLDDAVEFAGRFWGSYVAYVERRDGFEIVRDPSGGLGCYMTCAQNRFYLTSMPHLMIDGGVVDGSINWDIMARLLMRHAARSEKTALTGITELLPGKAIVITASGSGAPRPIWDPWQYVRRGHSDDPATTLRDVLDTTLASWAGTAAKPLVEVSGGLDSAIAAAGIARAAPGAELITFAPADGDPDETHYAIALGEHLGLKLTIARPRIDAVDLTRSRARDLPRPTARAFTQAADDCSLSQARNIGADLFVSGGGGDDVFGYQRNVLPAIDRWRAEGLLGALRSSADIAIMNHATIWDACAKIIRRAVRRPRPEAPDTTFLRLDAMALVEDALAPAREAKRFPGKAAHVRNVLSIHNYLEGHGRLDWAPIVSPLLSQPIVEACLAVPSWKWCENGINRTVARQAYRHRLPARVIERRSKGSFEGFCTQLFERNRALIGDMLIDGALARTHLLDRGAIAAALATSFPPPKDMMRLLELVDAESWTLSWLTRPSYRG